MESEGRCQLCGNPLEEGDEDACPSCLLGLGFSGGEEKQSPEEALIAATLERLPPDIKVVGLIGRGGMGVVYQARQVELDRIVALKILSPQLAEEPEFTVRFAREARLMAKLNHPNIVTVHNFGSADGLCYLIMEHVVGQSLADVIDEDKLSTAEALALGLKICGALRFAHSQGVIHRDIKPENILIDAAGEPKVTDFGLAKLVDGHPHALALTLPAQSLGTPYYMAPEQRDNPLGTDERADVYALGVTLYQLLTGQLPTGRFPLPSEISGVSKDLDHVILRAMQTDRELRQADAGVLYAELQSPGTLELPGDPPGTVGDASSPAAPAPAPAVLGPQAAAGPEAPAVPLEPRKTVFLAFTGGDLESQRDRLKLELINAGHRVVPAASALPLNAPQAEAILRSALMTADVAVQLVGSHYGWIPDASDRSIVEIQHLLTSEECRRHQIERLIWIPPGLHSIDDRLRRFLVMVQQEADLSPHTQILHVSFEQLVPVLQEKLTEPAEAVTTAKTHSSASLAPHVYLINELVDEESADRVEDYLFDLGFEVTRPASTGTSDEMETAHQRNLASCDAALVYYGEARKTWVDMILMDLKQIAKVSNANPLPVQGLLIGPPMDRRKQRLRTHVAEVMRFDSEFAEIVLEPFVVQVAESLARRG